MNSNSKSINNNDIKVENRNKINNNELINKNTSFNNSVNNQPKNMTNEYKTIKCYCNDNSLCPKSPNTNSATSEWQDDNFNPFDLNSEFYRSIKSTPNKDSKTIDIDKLIKATNGNIRHCVTNTVCLTKRLIRKNGEFRHKYYCDQSSANSIRGKVVEYRDCKINTPILSDQILVKEKSAEFCCNEREYCNLNLYPEVAVRDLEEFAPQFSNNQDSFGNNPAFKTITPTNNNILFNPINLSLFLLSFVFLLVIILLVIFFLINKIRKLDLLKKKPNKSFNLTSPNKSVIIAQSQCSPYSTSTTTSSTASTSITSKENSYNNSDHFINSQNNRYHKYVHQNDYLKNMFNNSDMNENKIPLLMTENNTSLEEMKRNNLIKENYDQNKEAINSSSELLNFTNTTTATNSINSQSINSIVDFNSKENNTSNNIILNSPLSTSQSSGFGNSTQTGTNISEFEWSGSGSGAGYPQCVQRTIARQIKLFNPCIGKGRFGEVYKGEWRGEFVAVKTFNSADEKSWENECNIYNTNGFRHENILGFIAADNIDRGTYTELWLITEFHEMGSLYDYLTLNVISPYQALNMALSIVNGLVHLHMPIESCKGKPALAHCDLKSKNILVKSNLTCCIGDLGMALSGDKDGKIVQINNIRTGTKRYMAPEILSKVIEIKYLDAFQKAEMYSLGLIFWELLRRCKFEEEKSKTIYTYEYKPPYFEYISGDPDENVMKQIVCDQKHRPSINNLWRQHKLMNELTRLTEELWVDNPNERLNALRLKKSLNKIKMNMSDRLEAINDSK